MNARNIVDPVADRAILLEYAQVFDRIHAIIPNRELHGELPALRTRLYDIRTSKGWGPQVSDHLELMAQLADILASEAAKPSSPSPVSE